MSAISGTRRQYKDSHCVTCGSRVRVHSSDEGTNSYVPIYIETRSYSLRPYMRNSFWLENEEGEGMQIFNSDLDALLDKFFKENF